MLSLNMLSEIFKYSFLVVIFRICDSNILLVVSAFDIENDNIGGFLLVVYCRFSNKEKLVLFWRFFADYM